MTTTEGRANDLAEGACILADSGEWSPTAVDDVLTTLETLTEALREQLDPEAAEHLHGLPSAFAAVRTALGGPPAPAPGPSAPRPPRRRRIGLGPGIDRALSQAPEAQRAT
ncbi:hypothetical protein ACFWCA_19250 [Streptomyces phaeochromogenes]|uniref:hypothetical protein n=1 Tax=Streptomyces phaeochromogenes TaxID=1923 RepID=UPI003683ACBB